MYLTSNSNGLLPTCHTKPHQGAHHSLHIKRGSTLYSSPLIMTVYLINTKKILRLNVYVPLSPPSPVKTPRYLQSALPSTRIKTVNSLKLSVSALPINILDAPVTHCGNSPRLGIYSDDVLQHNIQTTADQASTPLLLKQTWSAAYTGVK